MCHRLSSMIIKTKTGLLCNPYENQPSAVFLRRAACEQAPRRLSAQMRTRGASLRAIHRIGKTKKGCNASLFCFGDPYENRTRVTAVKGRCLNLLTNGPGSGNWT